MDTELLKVAACGAVAKTDAKDKQLYLPLWMHAWDTAEIMVRLCNKWLPHSIWKRLYDEIGEEELVCVCRMLALTHDIGKIIALFQALVQSLLDGYELCSLPIPEHCIEGKLPHAMASQTILEENDFPKSFAVTVGAHHGKPQSNTYDCETALQESPRTLFGDKKYNAEWESCWKAYIEASLKICGFSSVKALPDFSMSAQMVLTGLLIMADWIASNTTYFPLISVEDSGNPAVYPERADIAWETLRLPKPWNAQWDAQSFTKRFSLEPNQVQQTIIDTVSNAQHPGLVILEAQMGCGKTEAALAAAEILAAQTGCGGLFFGLPTQATANGLFNRVKHWAEKQSEDETHGIRLAHGASALNAEYQELFRGTAQIAQDANEEGGLIVHNWFSGRKQALLADFVIGTVDQLLMAALPQKHIMLRHLGLAGKVVIVDEVHSYSPYMNCYLDRALTWLGEYKVPVVLLSATLPEERRIDMMHAYLQGYTRQKKDWEKPSFEDDIAWQSNLMYPLLTWSDGEKVDQQVIKTQSVPKKIRIERIAMNQIASCLREELADGGCTGIVVNTVRRAQKLAEQLRHELPDMRILVFHSQFIMEDRAQRENELLERVGKNSTPEQRDKLVIIGTQVIEQSLDLDFDFMMTDLCPMDLLLQRIGRLHRHERVRPARLQMPQCMVLEADTDELEPGAQAIYGAWLLLRTNSFLPEQITLPDDIPILVQHVYRTPEMSALSEPEKPAWNEYELEKQKQQSKNNKLILSAPKYGSRFGTIKGLLDWHELDNDASAQAGVRGGDSSIEVLVLQRGAEEQLFMLHDPETPLYAHHVPSLEECKEIARQRLRLPATFSKRWVMDDVIAELEQKTKELAEWQQSPWLSGELFLLLDAQNRTMLHGMNLQYTSENGLCIEKEEENAGEGV